MMAFIFSRVGGIVVGVVGVLVVVTWAITAAYQHGRQVERSATLNRSVEILRERSVTDDEIRSLDSASLCAALGGVFADGACQ